MIIPNKWLVSESTFMKPFSLKSCITCHVQFVILLAIENTGTMDILYRILIFSPIHALKYLPHKINEISIKLPEKKQRETCSDFTNNCSLTQRRTCSYAFGKPINTLHKMILSNQSVSCCSMILQIHKGSSKSLYKHRRPVMLVRELTKRREN